MPSTKPDERILAPIAENGYFPWEPENVELMKKVTSYFDENGYVILQSHASAGEVKSLRGGAEKYIRSFQQSENEAQVFTTQDPVRRMDDNYFLRSSSNISCFLEEEQEKDTPKAINKIGHALHDLDDTFCSFSRSDNVKLIAKQMGFKQCMLVQSMYILKNKRIGGEVTGHRDGIFVRGKASATGDCLGYWWALQRSTIENGCLWAVPKSHKDGIPLRRFVRRNAKTQFVGDDCISGYGDDDYFALPMEVGDLILLHGGVVHKSRWNRSENSRHAYSIHVVEEGVADDCWLTRRADLPFKPL